MDATPVRRALISVSDKTGLEAFARALADAGVELLSTGGSARALTAAGLAVIEVAEHTGFPEIMDGRVKTLHPRIHGGILARREADRATMDEHGIVPIDLVVVNLYPFAEAVARPGISAAEAIEHIDIGGPAMVRAAAKNQTDVGVVTDPADYPAIATAVAAGGLDAATRRQLALKAFRHTAAYDRHIAEWLAARETATEPESTWTQRLTLDFEPMRPLRYGENPHQPAAFYADPDGPPATVARATVHQGKPLSFNNIADADTALECVKQFAEPACVIVKHANPCGVALAAAAAGAYERAYATDPVSAFGGIIAFNRRLDDATVRSLLERQFVEVVLAPELTPEALEAFAAKPNVRVLATGAFDGPASGRDYRGVAGGLLVQERDSVMLASGELQTVTRAAIDDATERDLRFAWHVGRSVKSNTIVYAHAGATVGIGAGQMSRIDAERCAVRKAADAGLATAGAVVASDAFIPFRDVIDAIADAGARAIIQPGGSVRDDEVIAAADERGLAMAFTGRRHFRH